MKRALSVLLLLSAALASAAPPPCAPVDAYAEFLALAHRTAGQPEPERLAALHRDFLARFADLYVPTATGWRPGAKLDAAALAGLRTADQDAGLQARDAALQRALATVAGNFAAAFADFRCDFPIYITPTFGHMDGAGRVIAGQPALVLGPDVIGQFETDEQLPVFLTHELFHRYHFQAAGFSDDLAERDLIWRTLWAEGLATYVSARQNPARPLADALLLPRDLQARADPLVPALAAAIAPALDRVDADVFGRFFSYGDPTAQRLGQPWRSGYYLGYLVAQRLGEHRTLAELAHLQGPALRAEIGQALADLAAGPVATGTVPASR